MSKISNTEKPSRIGSTQSHSCSIPDYTHTPPPPPPPLKKTGVCKHTS